MARRGLQLTLLALALALILVLGSRLEATGTPPYTVYLPLVGVPESCPTLPGESYSTLSINGTPTVPPAAQHPDLNLSLRGYIPTDAYHGLVDLAGTTDLRSPQLYGLFGDRRTPTFTSTGQVFDWDWEHNTRGNPITNPSVTIVGLGVQSGEAIYVPNSGYNIGNVRQVPLPNHAFINDGPTVDAYEVLVLYAERNRITLKYTRDDNVVDGYTLHVEGICVEPRLLALYEQMNAAGRSHLPALRAAQAFGTATGKEIGVAIRDTGSFMDPRSRKDWWRGR